MAVLYLTNYKIISCVIMQLLLSWTDFWADLLAQAQGPKGSRSVFFSWLLFIWLQRDTRLPQIYPFHTGQRIHKHLQLAFVFACCLLPLPGFCLLPCATFNRDEKEVSAGSSLMWCMICCFHCFLFSLVHSRWWMWHKEKGRVTSRSPSPFF